VDEGFVTQIITTLGLKEKKHSLPSQLSGGQQQRVAIARALVTKPAIVLADEPTGNLDSKTGMDVIGLLKVSGEKFGQTIVMITHNVELAQMADRIIRIEDGRIVSGGGMSRTSSPSKDNTPKMRKPTQSDDACPDSRGDSHA
jgi:putative ABC transport system ATP-binding protein